MSHYSERITTGVTAERRCDCENIHTRTHTLAFLLTQTNRTVRATFCGVKMPSVKNDRHCHDNESHLAVLSDALRALVSNISTV